MHVPFCQEFWRYELKRSLHSVTVKEKQHDMAVPSLPKIMKMSPLISSLEKPPDPVALKRVWPFEVTKGSTVGGHEWTGLLLYLISGRYDEEVYIHDTIRSAHPKEENCYAALWKEIPHSPPSCLITVAHCCVTAVTLSLMASLFSQWFKVLTKTSWGQKYSCGSRDCGNSWTLLWRCF